MPEVEKYPNTPKSFAVKKEIESQLLDLESKLKKELFVTSYVQLLTEKLQLQQLLKKCNNEN